MPNYIRMKRTFLNVLLWLQFLLHFIMVLSLEPGFLDFDNLPETNFSCHGKVIGGYYADIETNCQMFHVCTKGQNGENMDIRFLCLNGTVFDQETRVCERIEEVDCSKSEQFFKLNLDLYQPSEEQSEIPAETAEPLSSTTTIKTTTSKFFTTSSSHDPNTGYGSSSSSTPSPSLLQPSRQILSHHFPLNSADLRFNPEEINISLNPDSLPPQIRRKNQQHQQNDQQSQFLIQTDSFRHSQSYPAHRTASSVPSPSSNDDDDDDDLRAAFHRRYEKSSPRTLTVLSDFVNTERSSVPSHHHHHHQRVQIPYSGVLPTLPTLQFSSPAPFSPQDHHHHHHVDAKRSSYTKDHQHYSSSPRIIVSASASVSDQSGHRLNYSLGTIDLDTPTGSYDEDVSLHEFYHDVPKIQRHKRSTLTQQLDAIKNEKEAMELLKFLFKWYENHKNVATTTDAPSFTNQHFSTTTESPSEINVTSPSYNMEIIRVTSPEFNIMTPHTFDTINYTDDDEDVNLITTTSSPLQLFTTPAVTSDLIHTINAELAPTLLEENYFEYSEEIGKNLEHAKNLSSTNSSFVNNTSNNNSTLDLKKELAAIDPNDYVDDNYEPTIQKVSDSSINDKRFINNEAVQQLYTYYSANDQLFADKIINKTSTTTSGPFLLKLLQQYASESEFLATDTTVTTPLVNFEYPDIFATSSTETNKIQPVEADFTNSPTDENKTLIYEPTKINDLTTTRAPHLTTTTNYIKSRKRPYFSQQLDEISNYNKEETTINFIEVEQSVTINPSLSENARSSLEDETHNVEIEKSISLPINDLLGTNFDSTFLLPSTTEETTTSIKSSEEFINLEDSISTIPPNNNNNTTTENSTNNDFKTELETTSSFYESLIPTSSTITSFESNSVDSELSYLDYSSTIPTTTIVDVAPDLTTSNDEVSQDEYHENIFTTTTMDAVNLNTTTEIPPTTTRSALRRRRPHKNSSSRLSSIGRHRFNTELNERSLLTKKIPTKLIPMENRKSIYFNCFGKEINRFYVDPRDCRLFHYCTHGYTKNQLLDLKYVCDRQTYFDESKLTCTKDKPENCV